MEESLSKLAIAILSGSIGLILGHKLALGRDKRKEFNDAIQPLREKLNKGGYITKEMIDTLESKTGKASKKIVHTFKNEYQITLELPIDQHGGFDDFGNKIAPCPIDEIENNIKQREIATKKLKKLLALK